MRFGSVCSGIEAASVAWGPLGWEAAWFSEIESFPSAVLAHHYPGVQNLGDMTELPDRILSGEVEAPDLFCGGTPCQAFSVAGLRKSLGDARGNLSLIFCEIANAIDSVRSARREPPAIIFWENVPGVLSTQDNAFGCFLAGIAGESEPLLPAGKRWTDAGCVFGPTRAVAWRVFDAQYFGLAQRRKRVFVVASAREGFDPTSVLFEFDSVRRDSAPSREAREEIAQCLTTGTGKRYDPETETLPVTGALCKDTYSGGMGGKVDMAAQGYALPVAFHPTQTPISSENICHTIGANENATAAVAVGTDCYNGTITGDVAATMGTPGSSVNASGPTVMTSSMAVRRLLPTECEALQGFPRGYTAIPWRKKPAAECPDGPRYKALGNSWAVPVVRWIGQRINKECNE